MCLAYQLNKSLAFLGPALQLAGASFARSFHSCTNNRCKRTFYTSAHASDTVLRADCWHWMEALVTFCMRF